MKDSDELTFYIIGMDKKGEDVCTDHYKRVLDIWSFIKNLSIRLRPVL